MIEHALQHPQQLAPLLRALRRRSGMSQADLAARLGVTHQAVSRLEQDPARVSFERLMRVLSALKVELVLRPRVPDAEATTGEW